MSLTQKIAIAAGALTLGVAGVAAASTTPDVADTGLTKASEQISVNQSATDDATGVEEAEIEDGVDGEDVDTEDVDNHGDAVSAAAHDDSTVGRDHGEAVSEVAKGDHDGEAAAESDSDAEVNEADGAEVNEDDDDDADEVENENERP